MNTTEWIVIIICGALGYWIVSRLSDHNARLQEQVRSSGEKGRADQKEKTSEGSYSAKTGSRATYKSLPEWHEILEIHPASSLAEIKTAYRRKIQQYHPDRLEGMAPELKTLALEKSQQINAAYTAACKIKS